MNRREVIYPYHVVLNYILDNGRACQFRCVDRDDLRLFVRRYPIHWVIA